MAALPKNCNFDSLSSILSPEILLGLSSLGHEKLTDVQRISLPVLLKGGNVRLTARTGAGKTLTYLIPALEKIRNCSGVGCLILCPTRELCLQVYSIAEPLAQHLGLSSTILTAAGKVDKEKDLIKDGANLVLGTPGRVLRHLRHTKRLDTAGLKVLVLDEADRLLDRGFERDMMQILRRLPASGRQSVLVSATRCPRLSDLTTAALGAEFQDLQLLTTTTTDGAVVSNTPDALTHAYVLVPTFQRLPVLYQLLQHTKDTGEKAMVFMNSCDSVTFHHALFSRFALPVTAIHGRMGRQQRTDVFLEFTSSRSGVLLCTDLAARGWDSEGVDLVIHWDPPPDISEYVHRVGRTCRTSGSRGVSVLVVREEERPLLSLLPHALTQYQHVDMYSLEYDVNDKAAILASSSASLLSLAESSYRSYLKAYSGLRPRGVYDVTTIDLQQLAKSFGLKTPPNFIFKKSQSNNESKVRQIKVSEPVSHKNPVTRGTQESTRDTSREVEELKDSIVDKRKRLLHVDQEYTNQIKTGKKRRKSKQCTNSSNNKKSKKNKLLLN